MLAGRLVGVSGMDGAFSTLMTVLAGAFMTVLGGVLASGPQPYSEGKVASARVIAVDQDHAAGRIRFFPVVEFEVGGTVHHVTASQGQAFAPVVGATVDVSFPAGRPDLARSLHQPAGMMVVAIAVIIAGALTVGAGIVVWHRRFNRLSELRLSIRDRRRTRPSS